MRLERFWIAGAALVLIATACKDASSITGPPPPDAGRADALVSHTSTRDVPFDITEPNPCMAGEVVTSTGMAHFVTGTTTDNTGGIHLKNEFSFRGSGTGVPSLLPYTLNEQMSTSEQQPGSEGGSWIEEWRVIVKPPKPELTYMRHMVFKFEVDPTGTVVTISPHHFFVKCGGETIDVPI